MLFKCSFSAYKKAESCIYHSEMYEKYGFFSRPGWNSSSALLGSGGSPSAYPLMTLAVWCLSMVQSFTSIAHTLSDMFANKGFWLYKITYIYYIDIIPSLLLQHNKFNYGKTYSYFISGATMHALQNQLQQA